MMASRDCSSWLSVRSPTAASVSLKRHSFLFFVSCKKVAVFPSCSSGSTDSSSSSPSTSTRSYTRRWYNPLRQRNFDPDPEIERHWVEADHQPLVSTERFTVASYNILADRNAFEHRDLYVNVPSQYLKWSHRKRVICKELFGLDPDIICLQEVDRYVEISNALVKAGYTGSYKRRTGDTIDGCAMFWKSDKLRLLGGESIEFKGIGLRDNVAQLSVFEADA